MAPRKSIAKFLLLISAVVAVVLIGAGHSFVVLMFGTSVSSIEGENGPLATTPTPPVAVRAAVSDPLPMAVTTPPAPTAAVVAPWNFTHSKSRHDAVVSVNGIPIEPIHRYLKKKAGGRWIGIHPNDLRITPLLPQRNLSATARLVFIDLGARMYPGSTGWFLKHYPRSREFDVVVFELLDLEHTYTAAKPYFKSFTYERKAAWTHSRGVQIKGMRMARVDDNVVVQRGDNRQTWLSPSVDMAAYLKSNFTKDDFVVLKLDIEGGEWTLIPHLIRTGAMELIDEVFFECHPVDFDDYVREPNRLPSICVDFINDLRAIGVYCHRWF